MSATTVAKSPPPFPAPKLLSARRVMGTVLTTGSANVPSSAQAPNLERTPSLAGNILLVEEGEEQGGTRTRPFLLHRKIKTSLHGYVRLGFVLQETESENVWQLVPNHQDLPTSSGLVASGKGVEAAQEQGEDSFQMVAIKIELKSPAREESLMAELAALQWIATNNPCKVGGLFVPTVLAKDEADNVYTITSYQKEGSLFDYCAKAGTLSESEAKTFFGQMLEVRIYLRNRRLRTCMRYV